MIKGLGSLEKRLEGYGNVDLAKPVAKAILHVQAAAKGLCLADSGELRESIFTSVEQDERHTVGACYTNKAHATYIEFGTGPKGQKEHPGISPDIPVAYTQTPWWIPEGEREGGISKEAADRYHMPRFELKDGDALRYTEGQPARPFMYPALKGNEEDVLKIMQDEIRRQLL